jgi:hypothetical protein
MTTFIIENQKFTEELLNLINKEDIDDDDCCLIDGQPLQTQNYIELQCSHKFNYLSIFNELKIQRNYNNLEVQKLKSYQIKCPYCRNIHNGILPYNKHIICDKIRGINWPPSKVLKIKICKAILKSGKRKGESCAKPCVYNFCNMHKKTNAKNKNICKTILKSGTRKGKLCGCKCKKNSDYCGRHVKKSI